MAKSTQKYGLPYMGSKSTIAEWVISHLPKADTLVDAFAGGCALTHAAIKSRKFKNIIVNDITDAPKLFIDACNGLYKDEKRWISRECFEATKDNDPFVRLIWSFGNNQRNYIYGKDIEECKHAIHNAVNNRKTAQLSAIALIDQEDAEPLEKRLESVELYQMYKFKYAEFDEIKKCPLLAIDDFGIEPVYINVFGTDISPISELLYHRYQNRLTTIITTNLAVDEIRKRYGDRIADRFNEMMHPVLFANGSYRQLNKKNQQNQQQ